MIRQHALEQRDHSLGFFRLEGDGVADRRGNQCHGQTGGCRQCCDITSRRATSPTMSA